jgi:hypothetical protein
MLIETSLKKLENENKIFVKYNLVAQEEVIDCLKRDKKFFRNKKKGT